MPPSQNEDHTPDPSNSPSQPTPEAIDHTEDRPVAGGMKIIQPLSDSTASAENTKPEPAVSNIPSRPSLNPAPTPVQSGQVYPQAQVTEPITKSDIEKSLKQQKRRKILKISLVLVAAILLAFGGGVYYWYQQQDHSIYRKLTTKNYANNGMIFSFSYPSVMYSVNLNAPGILTSYAYNVTSSEKALVGVSYIPYGNALQHLNITPDQVLTQLVTHSGSFVNALNHDNPNAFNNLYGDCHSHIKTTSGQVDVLCTSAKSNFTATRVIGENSDNQYILTLLMPTSVWTAHQKVWQKVEKSFSYQ